LYTILDKAYKEGITVTGDDFKAYVSLTAIRQFIHGTVNRSLRQFSAGNGIHANAM
jgi:hypothetical protein